MSAEEVAGKRIAQPADEATEKRWQLICQNRAFIAALRTAIRSGSETAAGVTATVRTGRRDADRHGVRWPEGSPSAAERRLS
jgi:hypothetical protein